MQLAAPGPDDVLGVGQAERHEQQAGLVDVAVVLVDHGDLGVVVGEYRRRSRLAVSVPPVPPPSTTMRCVTSPYNLAHLSANRGEGPAHGNVRPSRSRRPVCITGDLGTQAHRLPVLLHEVGVVAAGLRTRARFDAVHV